MYVLFVIVYSSSGLCVLRGMSSKVNFLERNITECWWHCFHYGLNEKNNTPDVYHITGNFGVVLIWQNGQKWPLKNFGDFLNWQLALRRYDTINHVLLSCTQHSNT